MFFCSKKIFSFFSKILPKKGQAVVEYLLVYGAMLLLVYGGVQVITPPGTCTPHNAVWQAWSPCNCSVECGTGTCDQTRLCTPESCGGLTCAQMDTTGEGSFRTLSCAMGSCDDGNLCTIDTCNSGSCIFTPIACDDGNDCNGVEYCHAGSCMSGTPIICDDGEPCNGLETCSGGSCIAGTPMACDDGDDCNGIETCSAGACVPGTAVDCDDGDACNGVETCSAGACVPGAPMACDDGDACNGVETCSAGACVPGTPMACDDNDICNGTETCLNGSCILGIPLTCDDGNICTDDSCDPTNGCSVSFNTNPCNDLNACTENDTCTAGSCIGTPVPATDAVLSNWVPCTCPVTCGDSTCTETRTCISDGTCGGLLCSDAELTREVECNVECPDGQTCHEGECLLECNIDCATAGYTCGLFDVCGPGYAPITCGDYPNCGCPQPECSSAGEYTCTGGVIYPCVPADLTHECNYFRNWNPLSTCPTGACADDTHCQCPTDCGTHVRDETWCGRHHIAGVRGGGAHINECIENTSNAYFTDNCNQTSTNVFDCYTHRNAALHHTNSCFIDGDGNASCGCTDECAEGDQKCQIETAYADDGYNLYDCHDIPNDYYSCVALINPTPCAYGCLPDYSDCAATCSDECSPGYFIYGTYVGDHMCLDSGAGTAIYQCWYADTFDNCTEWVNPTACGNDYSCIAGQTSCQCADCTVPETRCINYDPNGFANSDPRMATCTYNAALGCNTWTSIYECGGSIKFDCVIGATTCCKDQCSQAPSEPICTDMVNGMGYISYCQVNPADGCKDLILNNYCYDGCEKDSMYGTIPTGNCNNPNCTDECPTVGDQNYCENGVLYDCIQEPYVTGPEFGDGDSCRDIANGTTCSSGACNPTNDGCATCANDCTALGQTHCVDNEIFQCKYGGLNPNNTACYFWDYSDPQTCPLGCVPEGDNTAAACATTCAGRNECDNPGGQICEDHNGIVAMYDCGEAGDGDNCYEILYDNGPTKCEPPLGDGCTIGNTACDTSCVDDCPVEGPYCLHVNEPTGCGPHSACVVQGLHECTDIDAGTEGGDSCLEIHEITTRISCGNAVQIAFQGYPGCTIGAPECNCTDDCTVPTCVSNQLMECKNTDTPPTGLNPYVPPSDSCLEVSSDVAQTCTYGCQNGETSCTAYCEDDCAAGETICVPGMIYSTEIGTAYRCGTPGDGELPDDDDNCNDWIEDADAQYTATNSANCTFKCNAERTGCAACLDSCISSTVGSTRCYKVYNQYGNLTEIIPQRCVITVQGCQNWENYSCPTGELCGSIIPDQCDGCVNECPLIGNVPKNICNSDYTAVIRCGEYDSANGDTIDGCREYEDAETPCAYGCTDLNIYGTPTSASCKPCQWDCLNPGPPWDNDNWEDVSNVQFTCDQYELCGITVDCNLNPGGLCPDDCNFHLNDPVFPDQYVLRTPENQCIFVWNDVEIGHTAINDVNCGLEQAVYPSVDYDYEQKSSQLEAPEGTYYFICRTHDD